MYYYTILGSHIQIHVFHMCTIRSDLDDGERSKLFLISNSHISERNRVGAYTWYKLFHTKSKIYICTHYMRSPAITLDLTSNDRERSRSRSFISEPWYLYLFINLTKRVNGQYCIHRYSIVPVFVATKMVLNKRPRGLDSPLDLLPDETNIATCTCLMVV